MKVFVVICCLFFLLSSIEIERKDSVNNNEYEVKAAFIYNFTKYIEWDESKMKESNVFKIYTYKKSPIEPFLKEILKEKKVEGKKIEVKQLDNLDETEIVHILFIPENISIKEFKNCVTKYNSKNTLIVSEKKGRMEYGSAINFLLISNKIKFEVNLNALKKNNLRASSQLLKLAESVEQ